MKGIDRRSFLYNTGKAFLGLAGTDFFLKSAGSFAALPGSKPLNFVFILIDDMGWADSNCYGSTFYETPNIDSLAKSGMRFTNAYAAAPLCSPTRASIMTGKYPARLHLTDYLKGRRKGDNSPVLPVEYLDQLPLEEVTVAEVLKEAGYATGLIGKWHLGETPYFPEHQGFDINVGGTWNGMPRDYFYPAWGNNPPIIGKEGEYLTDRLTEEAEKFIESNKDRPFFLYFAHYAVHIPIQAKKDIIAKYMNKAKPDTPQNSPVYAAMIESVDQSVGRVIRKLEELKIADRTVIFFTSDNGGLLWKTATSNEPLRSGKGHLYEGGIREPLIIRWPGVVKPGDLCHEQVISVDFFPTILEIAELEKKDRGEIDGLSLVPLLKKTGKLDREALYWHYPHFSNEGGMPGGAIRRGDYKLIRFYEHNSLELYNLKKDIGEKNNLSGKMPEKAKELDRMLSNWLESVKASMPLPNPDYKPPQGL